MKISKPSSTAALLAFISPVLGAANQVFSGGTTSTPGNGQNGVGAGVDSYTMYSGDGAVCSGWPAMDKWVSFEDMWQANLPLMSKSCTNLYGAGTPDSTPAELTSLKNAIEVYAGTANVDRRFVFAVVMQESKGCVRVKTTISPDNTVRNPGLMQTHNGDNTCNVIDDPPGLAILQGKNIHVQAVGGARAGGLLSPCPDSIIHGMVSDGVTGTAAGNGLAGVLNLALSYPANPCSASTPARRGVRVIKSGYFDGPTIRTYPASSPTKEMDSIPKCCKSAVNPTGSTGFSLTYPGPRPTGYPSLHHWNVSFPSVTYGSESEPTCTQSWMIPPSAPGPSFTTQPPKTPASPPPTPVTTSVATWTVSPLPLSSSPMPASSSAPQSPAAPPPPPHPQTSSPGPQNLPPFNAQTYYRAARLWNSGQLDSANLGDGFVSTNCFASDVANRLTGWTGKDDRGSCSRCTLDVKGGGCPWGLCEDLCAG